VCGFQRVVGMVMSAGWKVATESWNSVCGIAVGSVPHTYVSKQVGALESELWTQGVFSGTGWVAIGRRGDCGEIESCAL
jgi:hypothetical protein